MLKKSSSAILFKGLLQKKSSLINRQEWTTQMIQKIISLTDKDGQEYLNKNSVQEILSRIDKEHIEIIDKFSNLKENGFNLLEFVRFFLNILRHDEIQNLYLAIGLIDLFKSISSFTGEERVSFSHITNFLCQKILEKQQSKNQIESKNIPEISFVNPNYKIKDFIRNPPTIYGSNQQTLFKLSPNSILTDKSKHNRAVSLSGFSNDLKMIFTLDALSEFISVYDFNCSQINRIYPSFSKIKKDVVILGFAFSQRQSRIGAILKNFSMIFWDCNKSNSFDYQKFWSTTSHCQHLQSSIYYLEYFNCWITSDKTGTIYFWDLLNGAPNRQFKCKYFSSINTLCEIPALNIIAIVQQSKQPYFQNMNGTFNFNSSSSFQDKKSFFQCNVTLYNFFTGEILNQISSSDDRVPHTIQYSEQYQILFGVGLQRKIKLWEINPTYMDSSLKGELIGHENLITSFTLIKKTCLLVSCDDKGKIKLWDFRNFACIQTVDFSDKSMITNLLDMIEIGKIGVLGSRIHYVDFQQKQEVIKKIKSKQKLTINWVDFDDCRNQIYVFTQKDLRVIDMTKGSVKYIYGCFNSNDSDYTCFRYFACIFKFAIGNDKGEVALYDISTGACSFYLKTAHEGSVLGVEYDQLNKLFVSFGVDSSIIIFRQSTKQPIRQLRGNFYGKQISCFQLSVFHNLIAISTHDSQFSKSIFLWNYEYGKLSGEIIIEKNSEVIALKFINGFNILVVALNTGKINLISVKNLIGIEIKLEEIAFIELKKGIVSLSCDIVLKGGKKSELQQCFLIVSFQDGDFQQVNLTEFLTNFELIPHSKEKTNYNPFRESKQIFGAQYMKKKHFVLKLEKEQQKKIKKNTKKNLAVNLGVSTKNIPAQKSMTKIPTKVLINSDQDFETAGDDLENNEIQQHLMKLEKIDSSKQKQNTFPVKQISVVSQRVSSGFLELNILKIMNYEKRFLLLVGNNRRLKIFDSENKLICDLNINYPLPYLWSFWPKVHRKIQDKIYFAMKVLNSILKKYDNDISIGQAKNYKLKLLLDSLNCKQNTLQSQEDKLQNQQRQKSFLMLTEPTLISKPKKYKKKSFDDKIPLIQEQYTKKDLNFNLVKEYNFHEVAGPTLKQLDHIKKIELLQKQWRQKEKQEQQDRDRLLKMIQAKVKKNQEKEEISSFLSINNYKIKDPKQTSHIFNLRKKIDHFRISTQKDQQIKEKDNLMPFLSTNKALNFAMNLTKKETKKDLNEKSFDKTLKQSQFMKKTQSLKALNRITKTSFQDYYNSIRDKNQNQKVQKRVSRNFQRTNSIKFEQRISELEQTFGNGFRNDKSQTSFSNFSRNQQKGTFSSGSKFRKILTEMNQKVRQKKLQKIKFT